MITKFFGAGGFSTARFFYSAVFLVSCCLAVRPFTLTGTEGSLKVDGVSRYVVNQQSSAVEFLFALDGSAPEIPVGLEKFVFLQGKDQVVVKVPLDKEPKVSLSSNSIRINWLGRAVSPDSVFDIKEPPLYPLGSGDRLLVEVYGVEEMNKEVVIDPLGYVTLPLLDKVKVQGFTLNELQKILEEKFREYINDPKVNIELKEYGSRFVNIIGEVEHPGRISLKRAFRLLDAISEAGGFKANSGDVEVQRKDSGGGVQKIIIHKDTLLAAGEGNENIFVYDQDTVNVLPIASVYVSGQVKAPQSLVYNKDLTLLRAIAKAGGFSEWANKDKVIVLRQTQNGETSTMKVDADRIEKGKDNDIPLLPNDHIVVDERKLF